MEAQELIAPMPDLVPPAMMAPPDPGGTGGGGLGVGLGGGIDPTPGDGYTLQDAYNESSPAKIGLNATNGAVWIKDAATPLGGSLFKITDDAESSTYLEMLGLLDADGDTALSVTPEVNQSSTDAYTALLVNAIESTTGSGSKRLLDLQVGGASKLYVTNEGFIRCQTNASNPSDAVVEQGALALWSSGNNVFLERKNVGYLSISNVGSFSMKLRGGGIHSIAEWVDADYSANPNFTSMKLERGDGASASAGSQQVSWTEQQNLAATDKVLVIA